jgi:hypothetical protein
MEQEASQWRLLAGENVAFLEKWDTPSETVFDRFAVYARRWM